MDYKSLLVIGKNVFHSETGAIANLYEVQLKQQQSINLLLQHKSYLRCTYLMIYLPGTAMTEINILKSIPMLVLNFVFFIESV